MARVIIVGGIAYTLGPGLDSLASGDTSYTLGSRIAEQVVGKMTITTADPISVTGEDGKVRNETPSFVFPITPTDFEFDGLSDNYTEISRPGLRPLVRRDTKGAYKISFTAKIVSTVGGRGTTSCEPELGLLSALAGLNVDVVVDGMGSMFAGYRFRIVDYSASTQRMNPKQEITIADAKITLTRVDQEATVVPGMILLKDPPRTTIPSTLKSGTKKGDTTDEEFDLWTKAKKNADRSAGN